MFSWICFVRTNPTPVTGVSDFILPSPVCAQASQRLHCCFRLLSAQCFSWSTWWHLTLTLFVRSLKEPGKACEAFYCLCLRFGCGPLWILFGSASVSCGAFLSARLVMRDLALFGDQQESGNHNSPNLKPQLRTPNRLQCMFITSRACICLLPLRRRLQPHSVQDGCLRHADQPNDVETGRVNIHHHASFTAPITWRVLCKWLWHRILGVVFIDIH